MYYYVWYFVLIRIILGAGARGRALARQVQRTAAPPCFMLRLACDADSEEEAELQLIELCYPDTQLWTH